MQMLPSRIVRASPFRSTTLAAARRLPIVQQRSFIPPSINSKALTEEKYPDPETLTEAEDPGQVGVFFGDENIGLSAIAS